MKRKSQMVAELPKDWQQRFKASSIKVGFQLNLSRSMLEFLCAVADDCSWDRATFGDIHYPDNWISTSSSPEKRVLIERKDGDEHEATAKRNRRELERDVDKAERDYGNYSRLTPAGKAVVDLLKVSGLFVQSDSSIRRKSKSA